MGDKLLLFGVREGGPGLVTNARVRAHSVETWHNPHRGEDEPKLPPWAILSTYVLNEPPEFPPPFHLEPTSACTELRQAPRCA